MSRHSPFLLALVLALVPRLGMADGVAGYGLITPIQPPHQGFVSLFRSPALQNIRDPVSPAPSSAATAAIPTRSAPVNSVGTLASGAVCRPALIAAEARHGIPSGLLQAIGVVESGRRDEATGTRQPWPWTINAEGEPHFFDSKQQAVDWVRQAQARGMRSIDVGCAQVNLMHHPDAFASLEEAFDPTANADYAARFLKQLRDTTAGGNWTTAVGHYHSQTPELADAYRQQVQAVAQRGAAPTLPFQTLASTVEPVSPFAPVSPGRTPVGVRPDTGRLLAAPAGTVGRGLDAYRASPIQIAAIARPPLTMTPR